jgi:hypothetical protein
MKEFKRLIFLVTVVLILSAAAANVQFVEKAKAQYPPPPTHLVVNGLVDHPQDFILQDLQSFPMLSEYASMVCVDPNAYPTETKVWTGVPLFFLLNIAGIQAGANVIEFHAADGYTAGLAIDDLLHPTSLVCLQADGQPLSDYDGYPWRMVLPTKWGYKWVRWITDIEITNDPNYIELQNPNLGYSFPSTTPPYQIFQATLGTTTQTVVVASNSSINQFVLDQAGKQVLCTVAVPAGATDYFYAIIPGTLLTCDTPSRWQVIVDNTLVSSRVATQTAQAAYVFFYVNSGSSQVQIKGTTIPYQPPIPEFPNFSIPSIAMFVVLFLAVFIIQRPKAVKKAKRICLLWTVQTRTKSLDFQARIRFSNQE